MDFCKTIRSVCKIAAVASLASTAACTYGSVTWGGEGLENAVVTYRNCAGDTWTTSTNSGSFAGYYVLDGYDDNSNIIPAGKTYLISAQMNAGSGYKRYEIVTQNYEACPSDPDKVCDEHNIDFGFKPLSGWEHNAWYEALQQHNDITTYSFYYEICRWGS